MQAISAMFKDPSQLATACRVQSPCPQLLGRIQADMQRCMFADACYSPFSDLARQAAGEVPVKGEKLSHCAACMCLHSGTPPRCMCVQGWSMSCC